VWGGKKGKTYECGIFSAGKNIGEMCSAHIFTEERAKRGMPRATGKRQEATKAGGGSKSSAFVSPRPRQVKPLESFAPGGLEKTYRCFKEIPRKREGERQGLLLGAEMADLLHQEMREEVQWYCLLMWEPRHEREILSNARSSVKKGSPKLRKRVLL